MLAIDRDGMCIDSKIKRARKRAIERGPMPIVNGIIVHQTAAPLLSNTMNSYEGKSPNGSHFVIDRDGTIYQTASLAQTTWHVGTLRARCLAEKRCSPSEFKDLRNLRVSERTHAIDRREQVKKMPDRYPANRDSVAIELVGDALPHPSLRDPRPKQVFEEATPDQNRSLKWLVSQLVMALGVPEQEIFRHPTVSSKTETEASTAKW